MDQNPLNPMDTLTEGAAWTIQILTFNALTLMDKMRHGPATCGTDQPHAARMGPCDAPVGIPCGCAYETQFTILVKMGSGVRLEMVNWMEHRGR